MAKKSIVDKNEKRRVEISKYLNVRKAWKKKLKLGSCNTDELFLAMKKLDKSALASPIKYRNRCAITGRPRGYRGAFGLSRGALYYFGSFGMIVGLKKC